MSKLYDTLHYERFYLAYVGVTLAPPLPDDAALTALERVQSPLRQY
jgi:hypothetical protein